MTERKTNHDARRIRVVNPSGVSWAQRYYDEISAWARVLALKKLSNTPVNRDTMRAMGWRVEETE